MGEKVQRTVLIQARVLLTGLGAPAKDPVRVWERVGERASKGARVYQCIPYDDPWARRGRVLRTREGGRVCIADGWTEGKGKVHPFLFGDGGIFGCRDHGFSSGIV
jgi:hypothetical protein